MREVVISGIGSAFSGSSNVQDFGSDLLANKHLVERTKRWREDLFTPVSGTIPAEYFDEQFFGINSKLARSMEPTTKLGYLRSYEAVLDAGLHPQALSGSNTGVFACGGVNEFEQKIFYSSTITTYEGYIMQGFLRTMLPNRLSYYFKFNGPSYAVDGSWVGGHLGLQQAARAVREGECDAALVVAGSISRYGETSLLLNKLGLVTDEGVTRSFDANGTGAVRGDGGVAFFLQRADQAKRCYARVLATEVEFIGPRCDLDLTLPSPEGARDFLRRVYRKHAIDPKTIAYLEADGNGNRIRDACELNAVDQALVQGAARASPLQIGSVKSNIGHVDCVNGLAAICKIVVAMETGIIPATINFQEPNSEATGLVAGRLKVVNRNTPLRLSEDSVLAVNTMALSNMMGHTVLGSNPRGQGCFQDPADHLPHLITFSARTEEAAASVAKKIQSAPFDTNYYRLLQDVFSDDIRGYNYRGFVICPSTGKDTIVAPLEKRAVWFVYSGMGSQWAGMGAALMRLPVFAETIERLHAVLEPRGVDLRAILTDTGPTAFDNILKSFVGITACQIALTNVLTAVGVVPDGIVGHSLGELACAYADGCFTEAQAILAAFARGKASNAVPLIKGKMAAIGLSYQDVLPRLPPAIDVACHNSSTSCTLSGPAEDVNAFVRKLSGEGVFARAVNVSDIAYHSRYVQTATPHLLQYLKDVIPEPKPRSSKWITTSVPVDQRNSELAKFCSAEYMTNNLLSPVLFEEALPFIPEQAVLIELAPHGLMQAILKRALPDNDHIPLTQRGHADPLRFLLGAIGRMSFASVAPKVSALYPDVDFPVPRGTPPVAPLVLWNTDESTNSDIMHLMENWSQTGINLNVMDHVKVRGLRIFPLSEELVLMYESALSKIENKDESFHVSLKGILVKQWVAISPNDDNFLEAHFMQGTTETQLVYIDETDKPQTALRGHTKVTASGGEQPPALPALELEDDAIELGEDDVYQELAARGLEYTDKYKTIKSIRMSHRDWLVSVAPNGSLSAAIEAVLQVYILRAIDKSQELRLPSKIRRLDIDIAKLKNNTEVSLRLELATGILVGAGVYATGVALQELPPELRVEPLPSPEPLPLGETNFQRNEWTTPTPAMHVLEPHALSTAMASSSLGDVRLQFVGVTRLSRGRDGGTPHLDYVGELEHGAEAVRVMGVGRWLPDDRVPHLDPVLRWPVPASWSTRDAATVPFVYALVYHALQVKARARRGESILVHEGASAVGQAAIRVASQLGCAPLYTTAANSRERDALLAMFPQLQPAQVLSCGDGGSFEHRLRLLTRDRGVSLVVNTLAGSEFRATIRCLGLYGRFVNFSRENMQEGSIGTWVFTLTSSMFGCLGSALFQATEDTRLLVAEAVAKGIRDGVVQPIAGAEDYDSKTPWSIGDVVRGTKAVIKVDSMAPEAGRVCDPNMCYIVVGCQAVDALLLASRLAVLGARHILAVVGSSPSSPLVRQRQRALRRQLGALLQVLQVREWTPAAAGGVVKAAASVAPVHSAVVVVKSEDEQVAAALVSGALQPSVGLVLLADRECLAVPLFDLAEQRQALGRRTSCLAATLGEASERLGDLLHNSSFEVLPSATADPDAGAHKDLALSLTAGALAALSSATSQRSRRPRIVELTSLCTRGPHSSRENRNLFVLPPLSVLDPASRSQLAGLAARLFSPVLVVETTPGDIVQVAAKAVVRAVLGRQPHGPYNLLGWRLSTVLALEVQRQLEAAGKRGVLFLVHGDVTRVQQWAQQRIGGDAADGVPDGLLNVEAGAQVLDELLKAVAEHKSDVSRPFAGYVNIVRICEDELQSLGRSDKDPHVKVRTLADRSLASEALAAFINENVAWSQLAGEADLRLAVNLTSSPHR